jgi:hypothetical protein
MVTELTCWTRYCVTCDQVDMDVSKHIVNVFRMDVITYSLQ